MSYLQDLSYLNRDLSKVISLDTDPEHVSTHPENAIVIPKWKGDPKDVGLVAMIPFLECELASSKTAYGLPKTRGSHRYIQAPRRQAYPRGICRQKHPHRVWKEGSRG